MQKRLIEYISSFPIWALVLIMLGEIALFFRGRWVDGLYPLISFLLIWGFAVTVAFSVYHEFYVPVTVITSVWFGAGAAAMLSWLGKLTRANQLASGVMRVFIPLLLLALPIWNARANLNLAIQHGYTKFIRDNHIYPVFDPDKAIRDAKKIINKVEPNAIVFSDWDKLYSYIYTAQIEERNMGITFHEAWIGDEQKLSETTIQYIEANLDTRPIYFTVGMPGLEDLYRVTRINETLIRIERK